jgi:hypothetical protein
MIQIGEIQRTPMIYDWVINVLLGFGRTLVRGERNPASNFQLKIAAVTTMPWHLTL